MSWHGIDIEVMCWSNRQWFGPDQDAESTAFHALVGYCGTRSSTGRYVESFADPPFPASSSPAEAVRILDHLAERRLIGWSRDRESGRFTVELLPGENPPVTRDQALDQALRTLGRIRPDARLGPAATRLLLMIAWRCRQRHGQTYPEEELIRAAELQDRDELAEALAQLDKCEAALVGSRLVEGYVEVGLLFD